MMNLRHPYLLLVNSFFCFLVFAFPLHSQTNMNAKKDSNRFNQKNSNQDQIRNETGEESEVSIEVTHEIVSDFVWRGQSFSGDYIARRDNLPYKNFREAYTYVPVVRMSHSNGFFFELESNIALKGRSDRDSDQRIQSYPGGNAIDVNRLVLPTMVTQNDKTIFFDSSNAVYSDKCNPSLPDHPLINPCAIDPSKIKPYAEKTDWRDQTDFSQLLLMRWKLPNMEHLQLDLGGILNKIDPQKIHGMNTLFGGNCLG